MRGLAPGRHLPFGRPGVCAIAEESHARVNARFYRFLFFRRRGSYARGFFRRRKAGRPATSHHTQGDTVRPTITRTVTARLAALALTLALLALGAGAATTARARGRRVRIDRSGSAACRTGLDVPAGLPGV